MTHFTRTFHPVGQGAFYSETHCLDHSDFIAVYDCGSMSLAANNLKGSVKLQRCVNRRLKDIDILFISHFHADHINGVQYLNPKYIVIPVVNAHENFILTIEDLIYDTGYFQNFEQLLRKTDAKIIRVGKSEGSPDISNEDTDIDSIPQNGIIRSGTRLMSKWDPDWVYIPFNPLVDTAVLKKFETKVKSHPALDWDKIYKLDIQYIKDHLPEIKKKYEATFGVAKMNDFSMLLYSGPNPYKSMGEIHHVDVETMITRPYCRWYYPYDIMSFRSACLYTGDANLRNRLFGGSHKLLLESIFQSLPLEFKDQIGTIQIPHHGSKENYHKSIKLNWPVLYVISAGENNKYGHPSWKVIGNLISNHSAVSIVCQYIKSELVENGIYYPNPHIVRH